MVNVPWESRFSSDQLWPPLTTRGLAMWSNPAAFQTPSFLLDEAKPEKAALSQKEQMWVVPWPHHAAPRTRMTMVGSINLFMLTFGSPHQNSGSKAPILSSLSLHRLMQFGSEHLLPAGTFRKDPDPCSSCISSKLRAGSVHSNLGWKPTDLCLPEGDSLLTQLTFWQFHRQFPIQLKHKIY